MSFPSAAFHGSHTHKLANWRIIKRPAGESLHLGVSFTIRNDMQAMEWHTGQEPHKRSVLLLKRKCAKCSVGNNKLAQFRALELIMVVITPKRIELWALIVAVFHVVFFLGVPAKSPWIWEEWDCVKHFVWKCIARINSNWISIPPLTRYKSDEGGLLRKLVESFSITLFILAIVPHLNHSLYYSTLSHQQVLVFFRNWSTKVP